MVSVDDVSVDYNIFDPKQSLLSVLVSPDASNFLLFFLMILFARFAQTCIRTFSMDRQEIHHFSSRNEATND